MTRHYAGGMDIFTEAQNVVASTSAALLMEATTEELVDWQRLGPWPISGDHIARLVRG